MFKSKKVSGQHYYFQLFLFIIIAGTMIDPTGYPVIKNASQEYDAFVEVNLNNNITVSASASGGNIEFDVLNTGSFVSLDGIIIQESVILRQESVDLTQGENHIFSAPVFNSTGTYTLELTNLNTGITTYHSITL